MDDQILGPLVPLGLVMADIRRASMQAALLEAAQLCGEVRPCIHCKQTIVSFRGKGKHGLTIYFTLATGSPHHRECNELALARLRERADEVIAAHEALKETGQLVALTAEPDPSREHPDDDEHARLRDAVRR